MSQTKTAFALLVVFFAGCAASRLSAVIVPPARADAPAGTNPNPKQRWEYTCKQATEGVTDTSNELGQEGWELAAAAGAGWGDGTIPGRHRMIWCFKRPLP
jgi:hypothetical protein